MHANLWHFIYIYLACHFYAIFCIVTQAETLDETSLKKMLLNFEKKVYKNQEQRIKYPDLPEKCVHWIYTNIVFKIRKNSKFFIRIMTEIIFRVFWSVLAVSLQVYGIRNRIKWNHTGNARDSHCSWAVSYSGGPEHCAILTSTPLSWKHRYPFQTSKKYFIKEHVTKP